MQIIEPVKLKAAKLPASAVDSLLKIRKNLKSNHITSDFENGLEASMLKYIDDFQKEIDKVKLPNQPKTSR